MSLITGGYSLVSSVSEGIQVTYSYSEVDPHIDSIDVGYAYVDTFDDSNMTGVIHNGIAPATQKMMNNLPLWMEMREDKTSVGQEFAHAWNFNIEEINRLFDYYTNNRFLLTADKYENSSLHVSELALPDKRIYESTLRNLLFNGAFSFKAPARQQRPEGWISLRDNINAIQFNEDNSLFGNSCIKLDGTYGKGELKQTRELIRVNTSLTYSVYVKTEPNEEDTTDQYNEDEAGILLSFSFFDGTISNYGIGFPKNTNGSWYKTSLTVNITQETIDFTAIILNRTAAIYYIDLAYLEESKTPTEWTPSINDVPIHSNSSIRTITAIQVLLDTEDGQNTKKLEVFPVANEAEFLEQLLPTRMVPYNLLTDPGNLTSSKFGREITYFNEILPLYYSVDNNRMYKKSLQTPDVYEAVYPADLTLRENGEKILDLTLINTQNIQIKAVTAVGDILYVVTKETYLESSRFYLKFCKPYQAKYMTNYIQSYGDLLLDVDLGNSYGIDSSDEDIVRIGICKNIPNVIYIDTDQNRRFYFQLKYDYYLPDFSNRKLYFKENYTKENGHLQLI